MNEVDLTTVSDEILLEFAVSEIEFATRTTLINLMDHYSPESFISDQHIGTLTDADLAEYGFDAEDIYYLRLTEEEEKELSANEWLHASIARDHIYLVNQAHDYRPRNTSPKSKNMPSLDWSPKQNWVDRKGVMKSSGDKGLPEYISRLAKQFTYKKKLGRQTAIKWAVAIAKRWCETGRVRKSGFGKLNAGSRSQACAATKQWEQMKARA